MARRLQKEQKTLETVEVTLPKLQDYVLRGDKSSGKTDRFVPYFLKIQNGVRPTFYLTRKGGEAINLGETISAFPLYFNNDPMARKTTSCRCSTYDPVTNKGRTICASPNRWAGYTIKNGLARSCAKCPERNTATTKKVEFRTMFLLVLDPDDDKKVYLAQHEAKRVSKRSAEKSTPEKPVYEVLSDTLARVYRRIQNEIWFSEDVQKTIKALGIPQILLSMAAMKQGKGASIDPDQIFVVGSVSEEQAEEMFNLKKEIEIYVTNYENSLLQRAKKLWDEGKQDIYAKVDNKPVDKPAPASAAVPTVAAPVAAKEQPMEKKEEDEEQPPAEKKKGESDLPF